MSLTVCGMFECRIVCVASLARVVADVNVGQLFIARLFEDEWINLNCANVVVRAQVRVRVSFTFRL